MKPEALNLEVQKEIADLCVGYFNRLDTNLQITLLERLKEINNLRLNQDIKLDNNELDISL